MKKGICLIGILLWGAIAMQAGNCRDVEVAKSMLTLIPQHFDLN